jgi:cytochrome P450
VQHTEETDGAVVDDAGLAALLAHYDGYDRVTAQHYFEVTSYARDNCPVARSDTYGGYWVVSDHEDVRAVLSDATTYSNARGIMIPVEDRLRKPPQDLDPPLQSDFRKLLNRFFSKAGLVRHTGRTHEIARSHVDRLLAKGDRAAGGGGIDVIDDLAKPITSSVLGTVILNLDDLATQEEVARIVERIGYGSVADNAKAFSELQVRVGEMLDTMTERPEQDDVLNAVLRGTVDGGRPLTRDEQVGTVMQLMLGGLKTTVAALGHIVNHLAEHPELEHKLREPGWQLHYLDEFLRFEAPVKMIGRSVQRDVVLGGQQIAAGEMVAVMIGSANRDPAVFPDADELHLDRERNPHLAFGLGVHRCIGSNLARLEIQSVIDALLARVTNVALVKGTVLARTPSGSELSWETVPVTFDLLPED